MRQLERKDISFKSSDNKNDVSGYIYTHQEVKPFCVVQISHGMCEYIFRYEDFIAYLAENGVAVCGNDHIGHGDSSHPDDYGFFTEKDGRKFAIRDLKQMNDIAHETFPGLPVVLLGHSMGSFFARKYAALWPQSIDGLIISGTGGPNPLAPIGIFVASLIEKFRHEKHRSVVVQYLAFGSYLKKIDNPLTIYDWLTRDEQIVADYVKDPKCNFLFTVNGFKELFKALRDVSTQEWANEIPKELPILFISGDADPVGNYGKGVDKVVAMLQKAGVQNITYHMYPGARHEVLGELNKTDVYADVLRFLSQWQEDAALQA